MITMSLSILVVYAPLSNKVDFDQNPTVRRCSALVIAAALKTLQNLPHRAGKLLPITYIAVSTMDTGA